MIKSARKPSSDPIQEKLRQNKALWNKDVSMFINDLINFKKTINGAPSKFFKEKSRITEPVPADPNTIIGLLAGDFQDIAQRGNSIIEEQISYSKNRRKKQPKPTAQTPVAPAVPATPATPAAPTPPAEDLSKQLAANEKYELIVEGSNPITRFFARLLNPTIGTSEAARIRKYRMSLLDACIKTYRDLGKLQVEIVKSSKDSIPNSNKLLHQTWNDWMLVYRGFSTYKTNMPATVKDPGGDIAPPEAFLEEKKKEKPIDPEMIENYEAEQKLPTEEQTSPTHSPLDLIPVAKSAIQDYKKALAKNSFLYSDMFDKFNTLIGKFTMSTPSYKNTWAKFLVDEHRNLIQALNQSYGTSGATLTQIAEAKAAADATTTTTVPKVASNQLEALSQAFLKKWIGKTRHQLSLFDKTSSYRLDIYKIATEMRKTIDQIMDSLEKDMDIEELTPLINQVNRQIISLRGLMRALHMSGI